MTNLEKWASEHKKEVQDAHRFRKKIAKHALCPIENIFFTLMEALISDIEEGNLTIKEQLKQTGSTVNIHNSGGGMNNNLTTADQTIDALKSKLRRLEIRAGKEGYRRTPVSSIPIVLPIMNSDILVHNINIMEDEIPHTKIDKGLTIRKVVLSDGTYINLSNVKVECNNPDRPNIGNIHHDIRQVIASREDGSVKEIQDTLNGIVDFSNNTITLGSTTGAITSVVFSGVLLVEKI